jgi:hypothetical protein
MSHEPPSYDLGTLVRIGSACAEPDAWLFATHLMQIHPQSAAAATIGTIWRRRAHRLLTALILHQASAPPEQRNVSALHDLIGTLSQRDCRDRLRAVIATEHDPSLAQGWQTRRGLPTPTNPIVTRLIQEHLDRPDHEAASVIRELQLSLLKESA